MIANKKDVKMSSELLDMQFMRSTKKKIEEKAKRQELTEIAEVYRGKKLPATKNVAKPSKFVFCPDIGYSELQNLRYGRFAFNGINPEIAKLQTEEEVIRMRKNDPKYENDEDIFKDIPDEEMAVSSFSKARQGRGVFIEPADKVLNIYTEEDMAPSAPSSNVAEMDRKPSPRYAPYNQNNRGRGGNQQNRGRGNYRGNQNRGNKKFGQKKN